MQISFSESRKVNMPKCVLLGLLVILLLTFVSCSSPRIKVSKEAPPIFYTSGDNIVTLFQVSSDAGAVWKIYPEGRVSLGEIKTIKYGEVPPSWKQEAPLNSAPPPLVEGEKYQAFAVISDSDVVRVYFTIKEGKILELPKEH